VKQTYKIIFRSGDKRLEISPDSACRLVEGGWRGFDCTGFDVKIRSFATASGGYAQKRRFAEREISITFEISSTDDPIESVRRKIISMMDPTAECSLEISMFGVDRIIDVIPCEEAKFERGTLFVPPEVTLCFIAPAVFFRDARSTVVTFRDCVPILTFPMNFMGGAGTAAAIYRTTDKTIVTNGGDGECGLVARIVANGGSVVNPGIKCGEKFVRCPITLENGDELVIDTRQRRKNIEKNGERFFVFDKDSTFFSLPSGESKISVICDEGGEYIDAEIEYTPLYYGM